MAGADRRSIGAAFGSRGTSLLLGIHHMASTADPLAQSEFPVSAPTAIAEVVAASRHFGALGWTPATAGNFSVRTGDSIAITRSGCDKRQLRNADVAITTLSQPIL